LLLKNHWLLSTVLLFLSTGTMEGPDERHQARSCIYHDVTVASIRMYQGLDKGQGKRKRRQDKTRRMVFFMELSLCSKRVEEQGCYKACTKAPG